MTVQINLSNPPTGANSWRAVSYPTSGSHSGSGVTSTTSFALTAGAVFEAADIVTSGGATAIRIITYTDGAGTSEGSLNLLSSKDGTGTFVDGGTYTFNYSTGAISSASSIDISGLMDMMIPMMMISMMMQMMSGAFGASSPAPRQAKKGGPTYMTESQYAAYKARLGTSGKVGMTEAEYAAYKAKQAAALTAAAVPSAYINAPPQMIQIPERALSGSGGTGAGPSKSPIIIVQE